MKEGAHASLSDSGRSEYVADNVDRRTAQQQDRSMLWYGKLLRWEKVVRAQGLRGIRCSL